MTNLGSIQGRVVMPDGSPANQATKVVLQQSVRGGNYATLYTDQQGQFHIEHLVPGLYVLDVEADREIRYEITTERVQVYRGAPSIVTISLKEKKANGEAKPAGTVSVSELNQKVPANAAKEFVRATKASGEGKPDEAIAHLEKALALYPDYLMAHNDLGALLLDSGRFDEAIAQLRAAIKIDPKAFNPRLNLGIVLSRQNNFPDALAELDKAVMLDPGSPAAHLYNGMAAARLGEDDHAEKSLKAAYDLGGKPYAIALFHLGQLYMGRGQREPALTTFETYLREVPNATNAVQVQKLIGMLR